jgi:hypothetical protein
MAKILFSTFFVLAVIYIIPIIVYGILSQILGIKMPEGSPTAFLLSVLVSKIGTAIAFFSFFILPGAYLAAISCFMRLFGGLCLCLGKLARQ